MGYQVKPINIYEYISSNKILYWINYRYQPAFLNFKINNILEKEISKKFYLVWVEKGIFINLKNIKNSTNSIFIHFNPDNPFGLRKDGCWKLLLKNISYYNYHLTPRFTDSIYYRKHSKKITFPFCYDSKIHFHEDLEKDLTVTFIGSNHDNRYKFIYELEKILKFKINIYSDNWIGKYNKGVYGDQYRKIINRSKIMINFLTDSNLDEYSRRSLEIAACKTFFISQKGKVLKKIFRENLETFYFNSVSECAILINKFLNEPEKRNKIAEKANERIKELKLDNKYQLRNVISKITTSKDFDI
jgi:hypothetical protein|tara:strand:- start:533 stop:1438 length:906 start_codon:yes stop_codon:yes gene_type:complete